jgi:hypothetical protein
MAKLIQYFLDISLSENLLVIILKVTLEIHVYYCYVSINPKSEDTKGVTTSLKSKERQYNDQRKDNIMTKRKTI